MVLSRHSSPFKKHGARMGSDSSKCFCPGEVGDVTMAQLITNKIITRAPAVWKYLTSWLGLQRAIL